MNEYTASIRWGSYFYILVRLENINLTVLLENLLCILMFWCDTINLSNRKGMIEYEYNHKSREKSELYSDVKSVPKKQRIELKG